MKALGNTIFFCHKLFKDGTFLRKHLKKKHYEYCEAEQAKCHDPYMMKAWEGAGASRPRPLSASSVVGPPRLIVPDILVDCGTKYGCIPAPLYHVAKNTAKSEYDDNNDEEIDQNDKESKECIMCIRNNTFFDVLLTLVFLVMFWLCCF